jgi:hypothetical protein
VNACLDTDIGKLGDAPNATIAGSDNELALEKARGG